MPTVSVIMPVYNAEMYLPQCLDSIIHQTFSDIEIICVNDGSTDRSAVILNEFKERDGRIRLLHRLKASGSGAVPRNMGLDSARGEFLLFLDADDFFEKEMIERFVSQARLYSADMVICDNWRVDEKGRIRQDTPEVFKEYFGDRETFSFEDLPYKIFQVANPETWRRLIKREVVREHALYFQEGVPILDDVFFVNMLMVYTKKIRVIEDKLVYYRYFYDGSQTAKISRHMDSLFLSINAINQKLKSENIYEAVQSSVQEWSLSMAKWWLDSIDDFGKYDELLGLYQSKYFELLCLNNVDTEFMEEDIRDFYREMTGKARKRSIRDRLDAIPFGSRVVLYGAGLFGKKLYQYMGAYGAHKIILWCDRNADNMDDERVVRPEKIRNVDFDYVVISLGKQQMIPEIYNTLYSYGVEDSKIVNFWKKDGGSEED